MAAIAIMASVPVLHYEPAAATSQRAALRAASARALRATVTATRAVPYAARAELARAPAMRHAVGEKTMVRLASLIRASTATAIRTVLCAAQAELVLAPGVRHAVGAKLPARLASRR